MYQISNFTDNDDVKILAEMGAFQVIEYQRDLSVSPSSAITAYFSSEMNVRKRQLVCYLDYPGRGYAVDVGKCERHHRGKGSRRFLWKGSPRQGQRRVGD